MHCLKKTIKRLKFFHATSINYFLDMLKSLPWFLYIVTSKLNFHNDWEKNSCILMDDIWYFELVLRWNYAGWCQNTNFLRRWYFFIKCKLRWKFMDSAGVWQIQGSFFAYISANLLSSALYTCTCNGFKNVSSKL